MAKLVIGILWAIVLIAAAVALAITHRRRNAVAMS